MKTFITICFSIFSVFTLGMLSVFALPSAGSPEYIWNTDTDRVLNTSEISDNNPIREGMYWTVHNPQGDPHSVEGVVADKIDDHDGALEATVELAQKAINYALGLASFIAIIYLIYHGFLMLNASGDDKQFDKGKSGIKTAVIALIGIGSSRLIISLIFRIIRGIAG